MDMGFRRLGFEGWGLGGLGYQVHLRLMDKILHDPKDPKLWEL